jgi:hypothetical protein
MTNWVDRPNEDPTPQLPETDRPAPVGFGS